MNHSGLALLTAPGDPFRLVVIALAVGFDLGYAIWLVILWRRGRLKL